MDRNQGANNPESSVAKTSSKSWLQRLKDESWEAELLISAIAIFGTFQLFNLIEWATNQFIDYLSPAQYIVGYFIVFMGLLAVSILVSMFVIHFFLRAYWIGLVGLNSVFPDYSLKDSAYSEIYTKKILAILPKLTDSIKKIDNLSSVTFSAAFAILLIYSYLAITTTIYLIVYNYLVKFIPSYLALIPLLCIGILMFFQMIFSVIANLKRFKQHQKIQVWYYKTIKISSMLSFGPLYKYLLQITMTFASNFKQNKALTRYILLFLLAGIFVASYQIQNTHILYLVRQDYYFDQTKIYAGYYSNENKNISFLLTPEIESDIVDKKIIQLFIPIFEHERKHRKDLCSSIRKNDTLSKKEQYLHCYQHYHKVFINDELYTPQFKKYYHPRTDQFGILGYLQLANIKHGENIIRIEKISDNDEQNVEWSIPFQFLSNK